MIKYVLTTNGVINRETGMTIKEGLQSPFWQEYIYWRAYSQNNKPVPMSPGREYSLVGDEWVFDQARADQILLKQSKAVLREKALELFEFTFVLFQALKSRGAISNEDFDSGLIAKAQAWKQHLDTIKNTEG